MMKRMLTALLLALCLAAGCAGAETAVPEYMQKPLADFTAATADGGTFTLSEALQEKDLVLINLWATWCGPCVMEFPFMQQAYEQYSDRVGIIALSVDPGDTPENIAAFAEKLGLTFPMGNDSETGLAEIFQVMYIPTTVLVDKAGNVLRLEVGTQPSAEAFAQMFDEALAETAAGAES